MKKYYCPDCGKELTFNRDSQCYECECGYFEDWHNVENGTTTTIGISLEEVLRNRQTIDFL